MQAQQELVYPSSPGCALLLQGSQLAEQVRSAQDVAPPAFVKVRAPAVPGALAVLEFVGLG